MNLNRNIAPPIRPFDEIGIIHPEHRVMKNGIPLHVIQAGTEDVVRLDLLIGGGLWHQSQPLQAMFANRMLREGSASFTSSQIAEKLDFYGSMLELSSSVNCGFITLYSLNKHFAHTLEVVADSLKHPLFPEKELQVVRHANKQNFLVNSTKVEVTSRRRFNQALFGSDHPLGRNVEADDYDRLTPDILRAFYEKHYHSGNCKVFVSGKVTPEIVLSIEEAFGNEPWGKVAQPSTMPAFQPRQTTIRRHFIEHPDAMQSSLKMGGFVIPQQHPDFLKTRVMTTLFGGYFGSRLMSNIREDKGYTYGIGAGIVTYPDTGLLVISTEAANEYMEAIISEVYAEMDKLHNDLVPQAELDMVRNYMLGDWCRSYEGPFSLSEAWIYVETGGLDEDFFTRSIEAIQSITREEIRTLAQRYLCKENLIEVVSGKKVS